MLKSTRYTSFLKDNSGYIENQHIGTYYKYSLVCPRKRPRSFLTLPSVGRYFTKTACMTLTKS